MRAHRWLIALCTLGITACVTEESTPAVENEPGGADAQGVGGGADGTTPDAAVGRDAFEPQDGGPGVFDAEPAFVDAEPVPDARVPPADAGPPPACRLCAPIEACGYPLSDDECRDLCRQASPELARCIIMARGCDALGACFDGPQPPGPPPAEDLCRAFCNRQAQCIQLECAPGALVDGFVAACFEGCVANPPAPEELPPYFEALCPEIIGEIRGWYPEVDARCDNDRAQVCAQLCSDRVANCDPRVDRAACAADCEATWTDANLRCVQFAQDCRPLLACFGDPEGQALCERTCDRLQGCLEEACPPRIIPPDLVTNCTAGCLADPPAPMEVEAWEAAECRQIREFAYRNNAELRPICEGGREFRPGPDECAAFCDNVLLDCLGVGNRAFCLAGCAAFTRDQYVCALEGQGECAAVNACLAE
ncbi:MAG: hypothetical protein KC613_12455 [Myxococcales bacterium]|nr:hypothetical protein [Myxococcales bacterium]MCB9525544.1 hypothetical protein [Myxococcales bacterium]